MVRNLKEDMENKSFQRIAAICRRHGYNLDEDSCLIIRNGVRYLDIYIYPDSDKEYAPSIYGPSRASEKRILSNAKFTISTPSFGSLDIDEYRKFKNAVQDAYELVQILSDYDFSDFPEVIDED